MGCVIVFMQLMSDELRPLLRAKSARLPIKPQPGEP
jgi:hypothetical protein